MRIAVFTESFRPYTSGVVRSIETFGAELLDLGHEVYIFAPRYYGSAAAFQPQSGRRRVASQIFRYWSVPVPTYRGFAVPLPLSPRAGALLAALGIDIVHTHAPFAMGRFGAGLARRLGLPLVFTHHTMYHEYVHYLPGGQRLWRGLTLRYVGAYCRLADAVIAPTPEIREFIRRTYGLLDRRVVAIPTGVALEDFGEAEPGWLRRRLGIAADAPVLVFVGRLGREKNVGLLLAAQSRLRALVPDAHLVLVGDGPERARLERQAAALGVADRVHFTGALGKEQVARAYRDATLFVIASQTETQGLATLEAMAAGLPVVGVDAAGTRDLVRDGIEGHLTPADAEALARRVAALLQDEPRLRQLGRQALRRAASLSARRMALRLIGVYQGLLEAYGRRPAHHDRPQYAPGSGVP
ncbi:MAG TPA: glycosyltransferase family 4 protein [Bacillota bacterium]